MFEGNVYDQMTPSEAIMEAAHGLERW
ncbi:protein of unknown function [Candidatus Promineifilum breve]|uniref:Uncharacterized protein n=1 Tax=Candidatus Promineifilum breve TaxID=1806508 RepID=A0A160T181_9CHLR|nr:protein of unknown function [Candidatus Promineifilum breve]